MRIRGLSWDKQAQASLPATTKAAFCSCWDPRGAPLLPPSSLVLASARKRGGKSHQWHHSGRRGGGRREGKSDSRDASYSDRLFFSFFPQKAFFGGNNHGSVQTRQTEELCSKPPCWAHPVQPGVMAGTHHPTPCSACCKLTQNPRSQENSQPHPPQHVLVCHSP